MRRYISPLRPGFAGEGTTTSNSPKTRPPDLVIEAVYTHDADEAIEVWRRFGVPGMESETAWINALRLWVAATRVDRRKRLSEAGV